MSNESQSIQIPSKPDITEIIIFVLREEYAPVVSWSKNDPLPAEVEFKTTTEIIEEINSFGTTDRDTVTQAMLAAGFTIRTIEGKPYWILRKK